MFSDVAHDVLESILDALSPDYAYPDVYPRIVVINMLSAIILTTMVSDARGPDGKFFGGQTLNDLKRKSFEKAIELYDEKMAESK